MKYSLLLIFSIFSLSLFSQQKGVSPMQSAVGSEQSGSMYAVIVGISDYQDEGIPDLRFADKDAEAFAAFLQSPAGGSMDKDHLKVLLNEQATQAQFAAALDWLWEVVGEDDKAIIYFSGHGDVEKKSFTQPGFLLCWDAPARVYMAGGAFPLSMVQEVITTLSLQNKAKVIMVADACRSGKLSGSKVGGAQLTNSNLAKQYANEIKILSCQPDEYSIEGEQWGGGRGAFSYHLLDGLTGMADGNADNAVSLKEIGRYLEDYVTEEVTPEKQNPMVLGDKAEKLADVFPEILAQLKEGKRGQLQLFTATESRGIENEVLAAADTNIVERYRAFQKAIDERQFLEPASACADFYYSTLSQEPQLERLHSSMRRNYAAALQDDAQQVLNRLLESNPAVVNQTLFSKIINFKSYPQIIRRAAELLGKNHYMYPSLMARSYWFEGYIKDESNCFCRNFANASKVLPYYKKALEFQPEMPHAWYQMATVHGFQLNNFDSMEYYMNKAIETVPGWAAAYYWPAYIYGTFRTGTGENSSLNKAAKWLERGLEMDSNSVLLLSELGAYYSGLGRYEEAEYLFIKSLLIEPNTQTNIYHLRNYARWGKIKKGEQALKRALEVDSSFILRPEYGEFYYDSGQDEKAKAWLRQILDMDVHEPSLYSSIAKYHGRYYHEECRQLLLKSLEQDSTDAMAYNFLSLVEEGFLPIDLDKQIRIYDKAIMLDPNAPLYHSNQGYVYVLQDNFPKAKEKFLKASSLDSAFISPYVGLYCLYLKNDMVKEAEEALQKGMAIDADYFIDILSWIDPYLKGDLYFRKLETMFPDNPLVNFYRGISLCFVDKDNEAAFIELEKAMKKGFKDIFLLHQEFRLRDLKLERDRWDALLQKYFPELFNIPDK